MEIRRKLVRSRSLGAALALATLCVACNEVTTNETACLTYATVAVIVQIAGDQPSVTAVTASHGGFTRQCFGTTKDQDDAGGTISYFCMELGYGPTRGDYTIDVNAGDQLWSKSVHVDGDACHVTKAETVTIDLSSEPVGRALLADCADDTGRTDCCRDVPQEGPCSAEGLACQSPCEFPSADADRGTQTQWSCVGGTWVGGDESTCTKKSARKPGT